MTEHVEMSFTKPFSLSTGYSVFARDNVGLYIRTGMCHLLLGRVFTLVCLPEQETRGGILVAWRDDVFLAECHRVHCYSVLIKFKTDGEQSWWFSGIYGPHLDAEKPAFLEELREVRSLCSGPWMLAGDFNMIYS